MADRIVVFGATGYTGRLVSEALVRRGARPLLAARSEERLAALVSELGGGLETAVANVDDPQSVRRLVGHGDVLISTVGPFVRWGRPALEAAIAKRAHYLDSTGEAPFVRDVFQRFGQLAESAEIGLFTGFGYDYVPGNLAGALALEDAGPAAVRVDVGYFVVGRASMSAFSGGTQASAVGMMLEKAHAWRGGRLVTERAGARVRSFDVRGRPQAAISIGGTEQLALPRLSSSVTAVDVYLGWFGPLARPLQALSAGMDLAFRVPAIKEAVRTAGSRFVQGSTGGPDAEARAKVGTHVVGVASDAGGRPLATVHLQGPNPYDFTGDILAWGAQAALEGGLHGAGALGPVDGFGLERLRAGCSEAGLNRV